MKRLWAVVTTWPELWNRTHLMLLLALEFSHLNQLWCSVAQSCPTLWSHGWQHTGFPCPSSPPEACSNSCPLSWWCHPTISSSVIPFSSCLQSFPASGSFLMRWLFTSGDHMYWSFTFNISPSNEYSEFLQDWLVWSPCCPRDSQESSPAPQFKSVNS